MSSILATQNTLTLLATSGGGGGGPEAVVWKNAVGVSVSGNNLTSTINGWGNSGACSTRALASGEGYMEFMVPNNTTTAIMAGLSLGDASQHYSEIDFAIYCANGGALWAYENGSGYNIGTYLATDLFRVAVEGASVVYRKNGTLLRTSPVAPAYPLRVDTALKVLGNQINSVGIFGAALTDV